MSFVPTPFDEWIRFRQAWDSNPGCPMARRLRDRIVIHNQGFAIQIARKHPAKIDSDDKEQLGLMGLTRAVERYDPKIGANFTSYAKGFITGAIAHHVRDNRFIKIERSDYRLASTARKMVKILEGLNDGASPSDIEVAACCGVPVERLKQAREAWAAKTCAMPTDESGALISIEDKKIRPSVEEWDERERRIREASQIVWRSHLPPDHQEILIAYSFHGASISGLAVKYKQSEIEIQRIIQQSREQLRHGPNNRNHNDRRIRLFKSIRGQSSRRKAKGRGNKGSATASISVHC